jgi:outer membrane protein assembly factor BamB
MNTKALVLLLALSGAPAAENDWSQWRGPNRDGRSADTGLLKSWPSSGPALAWKATGIGAGYSSVSVLGDRLYTLGDQGSDCNLVAVNPADGKILWQTKIGEAHTTGRPDWTGARCTPGTDGKIVIALGPLGELVCVDAATGKPKWSKHLHRDFGGQVGGWKYSESPLIDGDNIVCTPGGSKGAVVALKKETGDVVWTCKDFKDKAEYASLVPAEIGGVKQYLCLTQQSVAGIAAADGKLLWRADRPGKTAVIPTPVYKNGHVFVASGYGVGCNLFKIAADGGSFTATEVYSGKQVQNHHGGVILVDDHLYELDDAGRMKCVEFATGKVVWEDKSVGKGSIAYADGLLIGRSEKSGGGEIVLAAATPSGYKESGRFKQPEFSGKPAWAHPVVVGGHLYIRDQDVLYCYDVKAK